MRSCRAGAEGEVWVRGHPVMQGYYRNEQATAAVLDADGWFHTGDLGVLDEGGYLSITGRRSDMFIVGGSNAYPAEIEIALTEHPAIKQAYVVGVPHQRLGEVGFAFVEPVRRELARSAGGRRLLPRAARRLQGAAIRRARRRTGR